MNNIIFRQQRMMMEDFCTLAVFGSGAGTTADAIILDSITEDSFYRVGLVVSSSRAAGIVEVASRYDVPCICIESRDPKQVASEMTDALSAHSVDAIALAGWLRLVPQDVINYVHGAVVNIHPALLPAYGGHGMYGKRVHTAVLEAGETVTGTTVHYVTERYDEGSILAQRTVEIHAGDTPESLMERVKETERIFYPEVIRGWLRTMKTKN